MDRLFLKHSKLNNLLNNKGDESLIVEDFESNPAFRKVVRDNETISTHVLDAGNNDNLPRRYYIPKPPSKFYAGDVIETEDYGNWLCTTVNNSLGYSKGYFLPITKDIYWIEKNNTLHSIPAVITAKTLYTTGVKDLTSFEIPNGMIGILMPLSDITKGLDRNMHFVFNKSKYKITFYDEISIKGILSLICEEVNPSDKDDMVNEIADRYRDDGTDRLDDVEEPEKPEEPTDEIKLSIEGKDKLFFGETFKYIGKGTKGNKIEFMIAKGNHLISVIDTGQSWCTIKTNDRFQAGRFILRMRLVEDNSIYTDKEIIVSY